MIGDRLRQYREFKGWKGVDFTRVTGISSGTLTGIEKNGKTPSGENLQKIAKTTDLSIDWLLTGSGSMLKYATAANGLPLETQVLLESVKGFSSDEILKLILEIQKRFGGKE